MNFSDGLVAVSSVALAAVGSRAGLLAAILGASLPLLCTLLNGQARDAQTQIDAAAEQYLTERPKGWEKAVGDLAESSRRLERLSLFGNALSIVAAALGAAAALKEGAPNWMYIVGFSVVATAATLAVFAVARRTYVTAREIAMRARIDASNRAERKQFVERMRTGQGTPAPEPPAALTHR